MLERLLKAIEREERAVLLTVIEGAPLGAHVLVIEGGERRGDGVPEEVVAQADELIRGHLNQIIEVGATKVFAEVYAPPPRLLIYGAVDTAEALCKAANLLGWRTIVADARQKFATRERIPSATELIVAWPDEALAQVAPDHATAVVVLTHDDKFDIPALQARASDRGVLHRRPWLAAKPGAPPRASPPRSASPTSSSSASPGRAASTSAPTPSPRQRFRSSQRSSPRGWAARAGR